MKQQLAQGGPEPRLRGRLQTPPPQSGIETLNGGWFGDRSGFDAAWALERRAGALPLNAREGIITHEFGEAYRMWLEQERPELWSQAQAFATDHHPAVGLGPAAQKSPDEAVAEALAVMHLVERDEWPPYVNGLRRTLQYEVRLPF